MWILIWPSIWWKRYLSNARNICNVYYLLYFYNITSLSIVYNNKYTKNLAASFIFNSINMPYLKYTYLSMLSKLPKTWNLNNYLLFQIGQSFINDVWVGLKRFFQTNSLCLRDFDSIYTIGISYNKHLFMHWFSRNIEKSIRVG